MATKKDEINKKLNIYNYEKNIEGRDMHIVQFNSLGDMITKIDKGYNEMNWNDSGYSFDTTRKGGGTMEWTYGKEFKSLDQTRDALLIGKSYPKALEEFEKNYNRILLSENIETLMTTASAMKRRRVFKEEGAELCIDRVLVGDNNHWQSMTKGKKTNIIKIGMNIGLNAGYKETTFVKIASLTAVVIEALTKAGFATEVVAISEIDRPTEELSKGVMTSVIKSAEEPLDIYRILSSGAPGLFRDLGFSVICNVYKGQPSGGLGCSVSISKEIREELQLNHVIESYLVGDDCKKGEELLEKLLEPAQFETES
jgi:hypothetical protein